MAHHREISTLGANVADSVTDGRTNNVALTHPYHEGKSCSKLIKFCPVVMTDRWTDGYSNEWILMCLSRVMLILMWLFYSPTSRFLASQFKIFMCLRNKFHLNTLKLSVKYSHLSTHLCVWTDRRTKINVVLAYPYHAGKSCSKFGWLPPRQWFRRR